MDFGVMIPMEMRRILQLFVSPILIGMAGVQRRAQHFALLNAIRRRGAFWKKETS